MGKTLHEIAEQLKAANKKVQLIYAFNGTGKTRLSREFRLLVDPKDSETDVEAENSAVKVIYYNAFTEDLFYWDNDLDGDIERKLVIRPNSFTRWILAEQGKDQHTIRNFRHFSNTKILPKFSEDFSSVTFSLPHDAGVIENLKISKGEERNFIWSLFYSLLEQVIAELKESEPENRDTHIFDELEYVFIDDPVSSLDDNHLIELAVKLALLISESQGLRFVITTHSPLFYNVLFNELNKKSCYLLVREKDGTFELLEKSGDSNHSFTYHLHLKRIIERAIKNDAIEKYHFTLLRNLYEKTSNFLGYPRWSELLPDDRVNYYNRIIQFTSHSTLSTDMVPDPTEPEKQIVKFLLDHLVSTYSFWQEAPANEQP